MTKSELPNSEGFREQVTKHDGSRAPARNANPSSEMPSQNIHMRSRSPGELSEPNRGPEGTPP